MVGASPDHNKKFFMSQRQPVPVLSQYPSKPANNMLPTTILAMQNYSLNSQSNLHTSQDIKENLQEDNIYSQQQQLNHRKSSSDKHQSFISRTFENED